MASLIDININIMLSALAQMKWYEFVARFLLSGTVAAIADLIGKKWRPSIGGLFLAFPAIFPASATLIEKHEKQKKEKAGVSVGHRGCDAAAPDGKGSAIGSVGLIVFAILTWKLLPTHAIWIVLAASKLSWLALSVTLWRNSKWGRKLHQH
jgi:Protein of unknown function (DUF3147)